MKKILFPVDGSMDCQKALDIAEDLAKKYDSTITVFHVFDYHKVPNEMEYAAVIDKIYDSDASREMLNKTVEYFEGKGVKANSKLVKGDPASDIIDEAESGEYDLCIVCTHGMSAGKRFLLGSVTNKVVHHIKVPILVVR
jgi:nucleotide-binding universal stress UspA family protein